MKKIIKNIKEVKPLKNETHRNVWLRFLLVILLFLAYTIYISTKFGAGEGFLLSWLTWSFFVLSTPVADAGFLIGFPLRLIFRIRMFVSEIYVTGAAILLNIFVYFLNPSIYSKTALLTVFKNIIDQPFPMWIIFILSGVGTFMSVKFGDELFDVARHKDRTYHKKHHKKQKFVIMSFVFVITLVVYYILLNKMGIKFS
ncbi:MAG: hypothetical protein PF572_00805 [Patescibacteria group bacterium]|nr:hypothetical protein [Patescibacteria group bacterium]